MDTLYVLTRTSGRPEFFRACRESVKALTGFNVVHIVHCDDPISEQYVECDILIRGEAHAKNVGSAPYNLYCNRLLKAIPGEGWVHFMDDDDRYPAADCMEKLLHGADKDRLHVGKVERWEGKLFPASWGTQNSYQTECVAMWSTIAKRGKWWGNKSGDHYYTRQLTRLYDVDWHDVKIGEMQESKGHGRLVDIGGAVMKQELPADQLVWCKFKGAPIKLMQMPYSEAKKHVANGSARITYRGTEVVCLSQAPKLTTA